jgi:hypothetical protein
MKQITTREAYDRAGSLAAKKREADARTRRKEALAFFVMTETEKENRRAKNHGHNLGVATPH